MALTAAERKKIPAKKFGLPSKAKGASKGKPGNYPVDTPKRAAAAKGFAKRFASPSERAKIDKKADAELGKGKKAKD